MTTEAVYSRVVTAWFSDADHAGVIAVLEDGSREFMRPGSPRLLSIDIGSYAPPAAPLGPITARQLRLSLLSAGITGQEVDAAIAAMSSPAREAAQIEWEYATLYDRDHPLVTQIGAAFGLSSNDIDVLWRQAMTI